MSPRPRFGWHPGQVPDDCRHSGVLLLLFPRDGCAHLVLTLRSSRLPNHAGQVSLPGGALEPGETVEIHIMRKKKRQKVAIEVPDRRMSLQAPRAPAEPVRVRVKAAKPAPPKAPVPEQGNVTT